MRTITSLLNAKTGRRVAVLTLVAAAGVGLSACSAASQAATPSSAAPAPSTSVKTPKKPAGIAGQVTAESGDSWTVKTRNGKDYTVTITPNTQYGTKKQPATAQQFPVGANVRVQGQVSGTTVQAVRIVAATPKPNPSGSPAPTTN